MQIPPKNNPSSKPKPKPKPKPVKWSTDNYKRILRILRQHFTGYLTGDGYDLRKDPFKDWTKYQRSKIRKQFAYIDNILSGTPMRKFTPKKDKKKNIRLILKSQGIKHIPKNIRYAYIPEIASELKVKSIKAKKITAIDTTTGKRVDLITMAPIKTITMGVTRRYVHIDQTYLLTEPLAAIKEALEFSKADFYTIQAGKHEIISGEFAIQKDDDDEEIARTIDKLIKKYGDEENNYWGNWLGGLIAYTYSHQTDYEMYSIEKHIVRREHKKKRKEERKAANKRNQKEMIKTQVKKEMKAEFKKIQKAKRKEFTKAIKALRNDITSFTLTGAISKKEKRLLNKLKIRLASLIKMRNKL